MDYLELGGILEPALKIRDLHSLSKVVQMVGVRLNYHNWLHPEQSRLLFSRSPLPKIVIRPISLLSRPARPLLSSAHPDHRHTPAALVQMATSILSDSSQYNRRGRQWRAYKCPIHPDLYPRILLSPSFDLRHLVTVHRQATLQLMPHLMTSPAVSPT